MKYCILAEGEKPTLTSQRRNVRTTNPQGVTALRAVGKNPQLHISLQNIIMLNQPKKRST